MGLPTVLAGFCGQSTERPDHVCLLDSARDKPIPTHSRLFLLDAGRTPPLLVISATQRHPATRSALPGASGVGPYQSRAIVYVRRERPTRERRAATIIDT